MTHIFRSIYHRNKSSIATIKQNMHNPPPPMENLHIISQPIHPRAFSLDFTESLEEFEENLLARIEQRKSDRSEAPNRRYIPFLLNASCHKYS